MRQGILNSNLQITENKTIEKQIEEVSKQITDENILNFYKRLLEKRPLYFYMPSDRYKKRDGATGAKCPGDEDPFEYLLYSEIEFGALLVVSADTYFINKGNRGNEAKVGDKGSYQENG